MIIILFYLHLLLDSDDECEEIYVIYLNAM